MRHRGGVGRPLQTIGCREERSRQFVKADRFRGS
jgi:hypothetical protein